MADNTEQHAATRQAAGLFATLARVFKAIPNDKLEDIIDVEDMWNVGGGEHKNPTGAEIVTGPAESMRGGNASPMVRRYSDGSAQTGMTEQYAAFGTMLSDMKKAYRNLANIVTDVVKNQNTLAESIQTYAAAETAKAEAAAVVTKAAPDENTFLGKASIKIEKGRKALRKAELEDEDQFELRRASLDDAAACVKAAKRLLSKAEDDDEEDGDGEKMEKAVADLRKLTTGVTAAVSGLTKAETDREEEKNKEAEAEEAKKAAEVAAAAAKAADVAKVDGTQKAETSEEKEKEDDTAKAVTAELDRAIKGMEAAAEGNVIMQTTLKGFIETFMNASRNAIPPSFTVVKSAPVDDIAQRIDEAKDDGTLDNPAACALADSLLHRQRLVAGGGYQKERFDADLRAAPEPVRQLFLAAA